MGVGWLGMLSPRGLTSVALPGEHGEEVLQRAGHHPQSFNPEDFVRLSVSFLMGIGASMSAWPS
jgi:hypothetical protein